MDGRRRPSFSNNGAASNTSSNRTPLPNIWQLQSQKDVNGLVAALSHQDAGTRRGAAAGLRTLGAWHVVPALQAALAVELDWQAYAAISAAIQYLDRDIHVESMIKNRDVKGLIKMLGSAKMDEIQMACEAIAGIGDKQGIEPLMMVFRNPLNHHKVRLAAAEALLKLDAAPAVVTLLKALRREDWKIRQNAAAILGQLQATWAILPLITALEDPQAEVRHAVVDSLRRLGNREALDALAQYEDDAQPLKQQRPPAKDLSVKDVSGGSAATSAGAANNARIDRAATPVTVIPPTPQPPPNVTPPPRSLAPTSGLVTPAPVPASVTPPRSSTPLASPATPSPVTPPPATPVTPASVTPSPITPPPPSQPESG